MINKFASQVHLTRMHQVTNAPLFDLFFKVTGIQHVKIKFWVNHGGKIVTPVHTDL